MRPLLGVVACTRVFEGEVIHRVIDRYLRAALHWTGADLVVIPALGNAAQARSLAQRLDGLLLTGSTSNVAPRRYGATHGHGPYDDARDETALDLAAAMRDEGRPVFGICRGFQELNVLFGGTLAHLDAAGAALHHAPPHATIDGMFAHEHTVTPEPGGQMAALWGADAFSVNSVHFEAIGHLGANLAIEARAPDGLIEAIRATDGKAPTLAVQWHPEWDADTNPRSRWFFTELARAMGAEPAGA